MAEISKPPSPLMLEFLIVSEPCTKLHPFYTSTSESGQVCGRVPNKKLPVDMRLCDHERTPANPLITTENPGVPGSNLLQPYCNRANTHTFTMDILLHAHLHKSRIGKRQTDEMEQVGTVCERPLAALFRIGNRVGGLTVSRVRIPPSPLFPRFAGKKQ